MDASKANHQDEDERRNNYIILLPFKKQGIQIFLLSSLFFVFYFQGWTKNKHEKREKDAAARTNSSSLIL